MNDRTIIDGVLEQFAVICSVPHPSGQEAQLAALLGERLRAHDLTVHMDEAGNLWADLPASAGRAHEPIIALQAHLDMVPVSGAADYVPQRDPVLTIVENGWLTTGGRSTLGADCGAGLAVVLWLLCEEKRFSHPPLRLIATVEEELGLTGAHHLSSEALAGVGDLINLDGFVADRLIVGSAGAIRERFSRSLAYTDAPVGEVWQLHLTGLTGGHSGFDIAEGRANANALMNALLQRLGAESIMLADISGGTAFNGIPSEAQATVITGSGTEEVCRQFSAEVLCRYQKTDPAVRLSAQKIAAPHKVWSAESGRALLHFAAGLQSGVIRWQKNAPDTPELSCNLGHIYSAEGKIIVEVMMRGTDAASMHALHETHFEHAARCGFTAEVCGEYPSWPLPAADDPLVQRLSGCFAAQGCKMKMGAEHVGLEVSLLREKNPEMHCISLGMHLENCHSTAERWKLDTIPPLVRALIAYFEG